MTYPDYGKGRPVARLLNPRLFRWGIGLLVAVLLFMSAWHIGSLAAILL
jgi:hypothetical protein